MRVVNVQHTAVGARDLVELAQRGRGTLHAIDAVDRDKALGGGPGAQQVLQDLGRAGMEDLKVSPISVGNLGTLVEAVVGQAVHRQQIPAQGQTRQQAHIRQSDRGEDQRGFDA